MRKFLDTISGRANEAIVSERNNAMNCMRGKWSDSYLGLELDKFFLGCNGKIRELPEIMLISGVVRRNYWYPSGSVHLVQLPVSEHRSFKECYYVLVVQSNNNGESEEFVIREKNSDGKLDLLTFDDIPSDVCDEIDKGMLIHLKSELEKTVRFLSMFEV